MDDEFDTHLHILVEEVVLIGVGFDDGVVVKIDGLQEGQRVEGGHFFYLVVVKDQVLQLFQVIQVFDSLDAVVG